MRVAIYVPTYEAEATIVALIERLAPIARGLDASVLIQDDASTDRTVQLAKATASGDARFEVLANAENLGYGGNLKRAVQRLAERQFDVIAMVHGDLQYRPEDVPALVAPLLAGEADLVLGSRMLDHPLRGSMPLYKWIGNKVLTGAVNLRCRSRLTDPHTGLVALTTSAADVILLPTCADGHEISADMCLRSLEAGLRVEEISIPTSYGPGSRSCSLATSLRYGLYLIRSLLHPRGEAPQTLTAC